MQSSVDNWEGLLLAMGGALVPSNCFWYLIDFTFSNHKWGYASQTQQPGDLRIKDKHQNWVQILWLELNEVWWMLGVYLAPDGNWEAEVDYLTLLVVDWKVQMAASRLSVTNVAFSLKNVVL